MSINHENQFAGDETEECGAYGDVAKWSRLERTMRERANRPAQRQVTYIERCICGTGWKPYGMNRCFNCRPEGLPLWEGTPSWL